MSPACPISRSPSFPHEEGSPPPTNQETAFKGLKNLPPALLAQNKPKAPPLLLSCHPPLGHFSGLKLAQWAQWMDFSQPVLEAPSRRPPLAPQAGSCLDRSILSKASSTATPPPAFYPQEQE